MNRRELSARPQANPAWRRRLTWQASAVETLVLNVPVVGLAALLADAERDVYAETVAALGFDPLRTRRRTR